MKRKINAAAVAVAVILTVSGCTKVEDVQPETAPSYGTVSENTSYSETAAGIELTSAETFSASSASESNAPAETTVSSCTDEEMLTVTSKAQSAEMTTAPLEETAAGSDAPGEDTDQWSETDCAGEMFVSGDCYAYDAALSDSRPIQRYASGCRVNISAITSTGYYRLVNGDYIRTDNLINIPPEISTAATRATTAKTGSDAEKTSRRTTQTQRASAEEIRSFTARKTSRKAYRLPKRKHLKAAMRQRTHGYRPPSTIRITARNMPTRSSLPMSRSSTATSLPL